MAISINQMRTVLEAGDAVPAILNKALPALAKASDDLAAFGAFVKPQAVEKVVENGRGGFAYVTSRRSAAVMDMPWSDAVAARHDVRASIKGVERILSKVKGGSFATGEGGPPSAAMSSATEALAELKLARTRLDQSLHVWEDKYFGGSHARLVPEHVGAAESHLARARGRLEQALRQHVNP